MSRKQLKNTRTEARLFARRLLVAIVCVHILLVLLVVRLIDLQLIHYQRYTTLSDKNQLTLIPIAPNRGLIYDKNGILIADNIPTFDLNVFPDQVKNFQQHLHALQKIIAITQKDIAAYQKAAHHLPALEGVTLKYHLTPYEVAHFYVNAYQFPGFHIVAHLMRYYPLKGTLVSTLGYIARMNVHDMKTVNDTNYAASNYIGKVGLEKHYEARLHGKIGYKQVEITASRHIMRILKHIPPVAGDNLYLNLDSQLQKVAQQALGNDQGAVVAIAPATGKILVFVSNPVYDPNLFVQGISYAAFKRLQADHRRPLYNRPLRALYPPGSTVKPMIALQLLREKIVTPHTTIFDPGWLKLPNHPHIFHDWKRSGHGYVNLRKAIIESCDVYFYMMGIRMGIARMHDIEIQFGLGRKTGVDIDAERAGIAPNPDWKTRVLHKPWYPGDTINTSIGQGYTLATPLQMAQVAATLAEHGKHYIPQFLDKIQKPDGTYQVIAPHALPPVHFQAQTWHTILSAMQAVVTNPSGTGHKSLYNPDYTIAAKTGTAQVFKPARLGARDDASIPKKYRSHSWVIAFAPVEHPQIALSVIVEHHPHQATRVARQVLDYYLLPHPARTDAKHTHKKPQHKRVVLQSS